MFKNIKRSLCDLLGEEYAGMVALAAGAAKGKDAKDIYELLNKKVEFYPSGYQERIDHLTGLIGERVIRPARMDNAGATTIAFKAASVTNSAPLNGLGALRIGEDGRVYLAAKSEHYHLSIGHGFPGYKLIDYAKMAGIPNATHNNTRGFITRRLEKRLIQDINGCENRDSLEYILHSKERKVLNRVINLETGSLAAEAGIKMMLGRFYRAERSFKDPKYSGKTPVFLVNADYEGGPEANYHGTTIVAQFMRGMWPEMYQRIEQAGVLKVVSVNLNDIDDFKTKIETYNSGRYKTAGFLHEIVLMNYGGIKLEMDYLKSAYELCSQYDTPTMVDEIQSCMWYKGMYLYKLYGLNPDFVVIGKGFPGGEYAASKIITTHEMDTLSQFGALVTNGQEELASLAYLITMEFARENYDEIERLGASFEESLSGLRIKFPGIVTRMEGQGHLAAVHFETMDQAANVAAALNEHCIDASAQTYKANCPPAVLLKPPVSATERQLQIICDRIEEAICAMIHVA